MRWKMKVTKMSKVAKREEEEGDRSHLYTLIVVALFGMGMVMHENAHYPSGLFYQEPGAKMAGEAIQNLFLMEVPLFLMEVPLSLEQMQETKQVQEMKQIQDCLKLHHKFQHQRHILEEDKTNWMEFKNIWLSETLLPVFCRRRRRHRRSLESLPVSLAEKGRKRKVSFQRFIHSFDKKREETANGGVSFRALTQNRWVFQAFVGSGRAANTNLFQMQHRSSILVFGMYPYCIIARAAKGWHRLGFSII
jgi:hypothetical protein